MRYRGEVYAAPGRVLLGGVRHVRSAWFFSRTMADAWVAAMLDGQDDRVGRTCIVSDARHS